MFPMFNMNHCQHAGRSRPRPPHCQFYPHYTPFNMSTPFVPFDGRFMDLSETESPQHYEQWMNDVYPGVVNILQKIAAPKSKNSDQDRKQKKDQKDEKPVEKNQSDDKKKKEQCSMNSTEKNLKDILKHALSAYQNYEPMHNTKWETKVDCHGFLSTNIKVKIEENQLLIKAFRKQESKDGLRTMTMRKSVPLPKNIDPKQITCKLEPTGVLLIQAPYMKTSKRENNKFVTDLLDQIVPGLADLMHDFIEEEKENDVEKSETVKESCKDFRDMKVEESNQQNIGEKNDDCKVDEKSDQQKLDSMENTDLQVDLNTEAVPDNNDLESESNNADLATSSTDVDGTSANDCNSELDGEKEQDKSLNGLTTEVLDHSEPLTNDQHSNDQENTSVMPTTTTKAIELLPDQKSIDRICSDDESTSVTSEDSFVCLSEFDHDNDQETHGNTTTSDTLNQTTSVSNVDATSNGETENIVFRLEMPSYDPESVKVSFDESNKTLTITATKGQAGSKSSSMINKSMSIGDNVDTSQLHCFFKDGALTVTAPPKNKRIIQNIPINF